jgi:hypothetical protein
LNRIAKYSNSFCEYLQLEQFIFLYPVEFDRLWAIHQNRHPGEGRGPELLAFAGFRLSPE